MPRRLNSEAWATDRPNSRSQAWNRWIGCIPRMAVLVAHGTAARGPSLGCPLRDISPEGSALLPPGWNRRNRAHGCDHNQALAAFGSTEPDHRSGQTQGPNPARRIGLDESACEQASAEYCVVRYISSCIQPSCFRFAAVVSLAACFSDTSPPTPASTGGEEADGGPPGDHGPSGSAR